MLFQRPKPLTPSEASASFGRGDLRLVDVREPRELAEVSIPGVVHIPLGQLAARIGELDPDLNYAVVCRSGRRSVAATRIAVKAGLEAANVRGGVTAWTAAELPTNTTRKANP